MNVKKLLSIVLILTMMLSLVPFGYAADSAASVAEVNGTNYTSLQDAIDAANAGDTVKLLVNIEIAEKIEINKSLTLDLGEYTITGNTDEAVLRIYSAVANEVIDVIIEADNGGIVNTGSGYAIYAGQDVKLVDGSDGADSERTNLTINGGTYETAGTDCIKQIMGLCTVNDGSYKSVYGRTVLNGERWYGSEFAINGGSFYGFNPACVSVWTGFDGKDHENNFYHQHDIIAEGKTATYAGGWYTVVSGKYTPVASTKSLCYPSLEAALKASIELNDVANLGVITLLADITLTEACTYEMASGTTLDLNGHVMTIKQDTAKFAGENITIKNGTVKAYNSKTNYPLYIGDGTTTTTATVEGVTIENGGVYVKNGATVTLKNNAINVGNKWKYAVIVEDEGNVTIESGKYFGGKDGHDIMCWKNNITVSGGTFKHVHVKNYTANGYHAFKNPDGTYTVSNGTPVASIKSDKYLSLQAAIDGAKAGDTVTLLADVLTTEQIVINESLTLDLGEYTITGNTDEAVLRIYSAVANEVIDVIIEADNGGIVNTGSGYAIYAGQDVKLADGSDGADSERTNLTINGGKYETAGTDCIKQIMGLCTVNGGSYKSSYGRTVLNGERWYGAEFAIKGGSFYGFNPACVSVWTGFDGKDHENNFYHQHDIIAAGKTATYADGWYTVVDGEYTPVASTKSLCYPSLEAALKASIELNDVANLGVITLLADDTLDLNKATITLPKGLVIDLNGKTLTVPFQKTLFAGENITIKNGTITTGSTENYGLYIMGGSFTVEDVVCKNGINVKAGNVTLKDVTAKCPNKYYAVYAGAEADVIILSGNYSVARNANVLYAAGKITAYGGTYNKKPAAACIANGYVAVKDGSNYIVREGTLQEIIDAAEAGATVTLTKNYNVAETITIDKELTLDLGAYTITSTAAKNVIYSTADLTINATTGGIISETARTAILQDNGVCTINGGFFKASGDTGDHANGKPVYNTLVLNNTDYESGVTGSFMVKGGKFYMFNPGCMSVNKHDHHNHDQIAEGLIATLGADGWFTVTEGEYKYKITCHPTSPASAHQHCFATYEEAELFIKLMGDCKWDKIVEIAKIAG